jgi:transposase
MMRSVTAMINALTALVRTNDLGVDARGPLSKKQVRQISAWRTRDTDSFSQSVARAEAKRLAKAITSLWDEAKDNLAALDSLATAMSPALAAMVGVGPVSAAQFLISWSHPGRIHSDAAFASLAGTSPIPASSGNTTRHRLNRGGDRQLNQALHNVILVRMRFDEETKAYVDKRTQEGKNKRETMRCLKRYLARKIHRTLTTEHATHAKDNTGTIAA